MSFFAEEPAAVEEPDKPEEPVAPEPWEGPPEGEVPAVLPVAALLGSTQNAAIVLAGVRVFSSGVELNVDVRLRRGDLSEDDWDALLERAQGFPHRGRRGRRGSRSQLRVGVALPDGTKVSTESPILDGFEPGAPAARLVQLGGSGSGSDRTWVSKWTFWLWPLPPDGPPTLFAMWLQLGLAETSVSIDGSRLSAIAKQARAIWDVGQPLHQRPQPTWSITFSE